MLLSISLKWWNKKSDLVWKIVYNLKKEQNFGCKEHSILSHSSFFFHIFKPIMGFVQNCLMNNFFSWSVITKVYVRFLFVFGSTWCRIWLKQWPQSYRTGSRRISENEWIDWVNANIQVIRNLPWHLTFLVSHHLFVLLALQIPPLTV